MSNEATNTFKSKSKDLFSGDSAGYSKGRPTHPQELIDYITSFCKNKDLVWDVATGNGQAAEMLAKNFPKILATDLSSNQLSQTQSNPKITYKCEPAEDPNSDFIPPNSLDLVTVSVAVHWFPLNQFYERVKKSLKPSGIIAVWCYWNPLVNQTIDKVYQEFEAKYLTALDPKEVDLVKGAYKDLHFPFNPPSNYNFDKDGVNHDFKCELKWDLNGYLNYLKSRSSNQLYIEKYGQDAVELHKQHFEDVWGDANDIKVVTFKYFLKVGQV